MDWFWYVVIAFAVIILGLIIGGISRKSDKRIRDMPEFLGGPK